MKMEGEDGEQSERRLELGCTKSLGSGNDINEKMKDRVKFVNGFW